MRTGDEADLTPASDVFGDEVAAAVARHLALSPAASMQDLARAAGISRATLFRRFSSRDALVAELCEAAARAFIVTVERADVGRDSPPVALSRVVSELGKLAPAVGLLGLQPLDDHVESALLAEISDTENTLRQLMRRGQETGDFKVDVDPEWFLAMVIWLMVGSADSVRLGRLTAASAHRHLASTIDAALLRPDAPR